MKKMKIIIVSRLQTEEKPEETEDVEGEKSDEDVLDKLKDKIKDKSVGSLSAIKDKSADSLSAVKDKSVRIVEDIVKDEESEESKFYNPDMGKFFTSQNIFRRL